MDSRQEEQLEWESCGCFELGYQICSHYENWCSEQADKDWWESLTQEERDSFDVRLCKNCYHGFLPTDDDREQEVCPDCVDWLDVEEEYGINF
jgi:hypothetical protein